MKAYLRSVRIAPKKANLIAGMVRGLSVEDAMISLERTNKKAARILLQLIKSALANARHNDNQNPASLVVKSLVINKAQSYHRGVPMARGRVRPIRKFMSHIEVTLGVAGEAESGSTIKWEKAKKSGKEASQTAKPTVKTEMKPTSALRARAGRRGASTSKKDTARTAAASARPKKST